MPCTARHSHGHRQGRGRGRSLHQHGRVRPRAAAPARCPAGVTLSATKAATDLPSSCPTQEPSSTAKTHQGVSRDNAGYGCHQQMLVKVITSFRPPQAGVLSPPRGPAGLLFVSVSSPSTNPPGTRSTRLAASCQLACDPFSASERPQGPPLRDSPRPGNPGLGPNLAFLTSLGEVPRAPVV